MSEVSLQANLRDAGGATVTGTPTQLLHSQHTTSLRGLLEGRRHPLGLAVCEVHLQDFVGYRVSKQQLNRGSSLREHYPP